MLFNLDENQLIQILRKQKIGHSLVNISASHCRNRHQIYFFFFIFKDELFAMRIYTGWVAHVRLLRNNSGKLRM